MMNSVWMEFKAKVITQYQQQKQMAEAALGRVDDVTFFTKIVYICGEARSVVKAIRRNLLHATHHIGQIDLLATLLKNRLQQS